MSVLIETNINEKFVKTIAKNYNTLDYSVQLIELLKCVYPSINFNAYNKFELHQLLNDTIINKHNGEQILKYELFQQFFRKSLVAAFEIKVNNSRVDFLAINSSTHSFEIKSSIDNLCKLAKQASDYILAFEYNYVVIDERHLKNALEILPQSFGLWSFKFGKRRIHRKATYNNQIDPIVQLELLTKKELLLYFNEYSGDIEMITRMMETNTINIRFKKALKERYRKRWEFIVLNQGEILPVDLQFFFKTNILPHYIYSD
jgi:hypothetical protein